jgi:seryl-tRNA synthetase
MMDVNFIRQNVERVQEVARLKRIDIDLERWLELDRERRSLLTEVENLRKARNEYSAQIAQYVQQAKAELVNETKDSVKGINAQLGDLEVRFRSIDEEYQQLLQLMPNMVSPDTPIGQSDADNVEIRKHGEIPVFDFELLDHLELGEKHQLFDLGRGVKVAGMRNYFLKGLGLHLHRAVQQLAIDMLVPRGYEVMDVPVMVREDSLVNTGFFPVGKDQVFAINDEGKYLVGTSEVPLIAYHADEIVDVREPIRLAGVSSCFRSEIGSAGRDVRGLYRVHQFAKVEQVVLCRNDEGIADQILQEMTQNAEDILQLLELPYRVVAVCTGDLSQKNYKQYDIETWMPSRGAYGETHSASNVMDFQARRSNIRYRDENGKLLFCCTLNNTAVATPRILIPLLENHQREDGSIYIPRALRKYMYGLEEIR